MGMGINNGKVDDGVGDGVVDGIRNENGDGAGDEDEDGDELGDDGTGLGKILCPSCVLPPFLIGHEDAANGTATKEILACSPSNHKFMGGLAKSGEDVIVNPLIDVRLWGGWQAGGPLGDRVTAPDAFCNERPTASHVLTEKSAELQSALLFEDISSRDARWR